MKEICLTCKVSKSMNKAELEKVIPEWYKEIGNYSLLPPILNNNDKYNARKTTIQPHKPSITNYIVKIDVKEKRNTWICYWAANYTDKYDKIKSAKEAYDKFQNHGLVKTNESGKAVLTLNCPQPYSVDGITYPRHVHYCLLKKDNFWSDNIKTMIVSCDVDFKTMKKFVHNKCHLIINVLSKQSYDRCKIPGSINIPLLSYNKHDAIETIRNSIKDFDKLKKFKGKRIFEIPIVVYCKDTSCKASDKMLELLIESGFRNLLEYSEGIKGWLIKNKKDTSDCMDQYGGESEKDTSDVDDTEDDNKKDKKNKEDKVKSEDKSSVKSESSVDEKQFDLDIKLNKIVYDDGVYKHDMSNGDVMKDGKTVGKYQDNKINFKEIEYDDSSSESSDYSSDEDEIRDDIESIKSDIDTIKYRKHKLSLVCMNDITPKVYEEKFRGWGFTFWGS